MSKQTRTRSKKVVKEEIEEVILTESETEEFKGEIFVPTQSQSQCVMIAPVSLWKRTGQAFSVVKLRNPKTNIGSLFAFVNGDSEIYEVNQFSDERSSWFIDDTVQSDGTLFLLSKIDPLFLIVPFLAKAQHTCPLDQMLIDEEFVETKRLESCVTNGQLEKIADKKSAGSFTVWKFNEAKVIEWLEKKIHKLSTYLKTKGFNVSQSSTSSNYVKSCTAEIPESSYLRYAYGMISEYISKELSVLMEQKMNLPISSLPISEEENKEPPAKKQKLNNGSHEPTEDYSKDMHFQPAKEKIQVTAKAKALASAAKGSKSIASFFGKK